MSTIGQRIKEKRIEAKMSQEELALRIGYQDRSSITKIESDGRNLAQSKVKLIADVLGTTPGYIMGWDSEPEPKEPAFKAIPLYTAVSAGSGAFADGNIEEYIPLPPGLDCVDEYFALRVKGDSMEPVIMDNDIVVVRKDEQPEDGKTVIAIVNGFDGFCKRFTRQNGMIVLMSNNPAYEPKIYTEKDVKQLPVQILGTVVKLMRDL